MRNLLYVLLIIFSIYACDSNSASVTNDDDDDTSQIIKSGPTGIYILSNGNSTRNIRDYDFITGYSLRFNWLDFETSKGVYDFTVIDQAIEELQALNQKLTLELLLFNTPEHVLDEANETWGQPNEKPVPWDENALDSWKEMVSALANHEVALSNGTMVPLSQHPTLETIDAPIMGLGGIRDLSGELVKLPSYTRQKFMNAVNTSIGAMRNAFSEKYGFLAIFKMDDDDTTNPLDEVILEGLMNDYNNEGQPTLGFFQELLSDVGPTEDGIGALLSLVKDDTYIMFQALTSWTSPFTGEDKVTSGKPAVGIELGYTNFNAKYFELYVTDIDNEDLWDDFRHWSDVLLGESED